MSWWMSSGNKYLQRMILIPWWVGHSCHISKAHTLRCAAGSRQGHALPFMYQIADISQIDVDMCLMAKGISNIYNIHIYYRFA